LLSSDHLYVGPGQWPPGVPQHDYWLFDSRDLWVMTYDSESRFVYTERVRDPSEIVRHAYWRDAALHQGTGYVAYLDRHPGLQLRQAS